jgi:peptidoglycan/xylan/chitin deacetylase (PgdA/CDA1 family)
LNSPLVLCYHAVSDGWNHALSVTPQQFEQQLAFLLRVGYRPATAAEAVAGRGRLLHVTFDDAFRSVAAAIPILERLRVPATVFACPAYADEAGRPLDVRELADEAAAHPAELATMGWDELRELVGRGIDVQSHTLTHPHLPELDDDELARQLTESRSRLEDELGRPCRHLAYPYGHEDARVRDAARAAGYEAAFGLPGVGGTHSVRRVGFWRRDGLPRVAVKTAARGRLASLAVRFAG